MPSRNGQAAQAHKVPALLLCPGCLTTAVTKDVRMLWTTSIAK